MEILNIDVERGLQVFTPWPNPYGSSPQLKVNGNNLIIKNPPPDGHGHGSIGYSSTDTSICEVDADSGEIDPLLGGNCVIQAHYTGNDNYNPSDFAELITILVRKFSQPSLTAPDDPYGSSPSLTVGNTLDVINPPAATGHTSVEYRPQNGDDTVCNLEPATGEVTPNIAGICVVEARFSESNQYRPSDYVVIATIIISEGSLDGVLSWSPTSAGTVGTPLVLDAVGNIEITDTITYTIVSGTCTTGSGSDENERTLTFASVGTCTVNVTVQRAGYTDWNSPDHDITVEQGGQVLTLPLNPYGTAPSLTAGGGDLDIETPPDPGHGATLYSSTTATQCIVDGNTGTVSPLAAGECVIEVQYAGNSNYLPSEPVEILRITVSAP